MRSPAAEGRLLLDLDAVPEDVYEPGFMPERPVLQFEAFTRDARLYGTIRLEFDRLTDLLNAHRALQLHNATFEKLADGTTREADDIIVLRSQLIAVIATGPRGDPALRRWTRSHPIALQSGDFLVAGLAHALPGLDPLQSINERPPMVPLTDAWIEHWPNGERQRQWIGTIIVNRELASWIRVVDESDLEFGRLRPADVA
ncbi:MAG TPA: hypothetical protein VFC71_11080 [Candidatus Polarisedimenticolia bacterium]|nr:hypothetical protein [Candidatus Polarisedimenticolia bacterium]